MNGYTPKDLVFENEAREKLVAGIRKVEAAVGSTLGPRGNTVLMESQHHTHGMTVTKDGVTVAKSIDLKDPVENLAVRVLRQASEMTARQAGDGTTTSMVLAKAIIDEFIEQTKGTSVNQNFLIRELRDLASEIVKNMDKRAVKVTKRRLKGVATISANNDPKIGKVISDAYEAVGRHGVVSPAKSDTNQTYIEVTKGIRIDKGYVSPVFANNESNDECVFTGSNVVVLLSSTEISNISHIEAVLSDVIQNNKQLVMIARVTRNVAQVIAQNVHKGVLKACVIEPPSFGYRQNEIMSDIALITGATLFSDDMNQDVSFVRETDLGSIRSMTADRSSAVIVADEDAYSQELVDERVEQLELALAKATNEGDKKHIRERIAGLIGGIAVVYAGGDTDMERKELYDRIDDAIQAVRSALEEGILPGGGAAFYHEAFRLMDQMEDTKASVLPSFERVVATHIMINALKVPMERIASNAGYSINGLDFTDPKQRLGFNAVTGAQSDMIADGIIDPAKVSKSAVLNAVSAASTIMTTNAVVTLARSYEAS